MTLFKKHQSSNVKCEWKQKAYFLKPTITLEICCNHVYFQNGLKQYCFVVFLLECFFVAAFIFLIIPETKNKSFLEIKKEFHKLNFGRNARKKETELYERRELQDEFLKTPA